MREDVRADGEAELLPWPDYVDVESVVRAAADPGAATHQLELDLYGDGWILRRQRLSVELATGRVEGRASLREAIMALVGSSSISARRGTAASDVVVGESLVLRELEAGSPEAIAGRLREIWASPGPVRRVAPSCEYDAGPGPRRIKVEPTTYCNLRCGFCTNPGLTERHHLSLATFERLWSTVDPGRIEKVGFTGLGESMLSPELWSMIDLVHRSGVKTSLVSNGTMIAREAERIVTSGLDHLALSIETTDPEKFGAQRVGMTLPRLLANLEMLLEAKERWASPLEVHVLSVLLDDDDEDWRSVIELCQRLGITPPRFYPQYTRHLGGEDESGAARRLEQRFERIDRRTREAFSGARAELPRELVLERAVEDGIAPRGCGEALETMVLRADGTWTYCNEGIFHGGPIDAGRLDDHESIASIWSSAPYRRHRLALQLGVVPPLCRGCPVIEIPRRRRHLPVIRSGAGDSMDTTTRSMGRPTQQDKR